MTLINNKNNNFCGKNNNFLGSFTTNIMKSDKSIRWMGITNQDGIIII